MKKKNVKSVILASIVLNMMMMVACSDSGSGFDDAIAAESSATEQSSSSYRLVVYSYDELPVCSQNRLDLPAYVEGVDEIYICDGVTWKLYDESWWDSFYSDGNDVEAISSSSIESFSNSCSSKENGISSQSEEPSYGAVIVFANDVKKSYRTLKIGPQNWMVDNFCLNENECSEEDELFYWYDAIGEYYGNCGVGYECTKQPLVKGVCPKGWHIPGKDEMVGLIRLVGGYDIAAENLLANGWYGKDFSAEMLDKENPYTNKYFDIWSYNSGEDSGENGKDDAYNLSVSFAYGTASIGLSKRNARKYVRCVEDTESYRVVKYGTLEDSRGGVKRTYKTVDVGTHTWMAENLDFDYKVDGESYGNRCYDESQEMCEKYGRLYTWAAAVDSAGLYSKDGKGCGYDEDCQIDEWGTIRGICPEGWHLPSEMEIRSLVSNVGSLNEYPGPSVAGHRNVKNPSASTALRDIRYWDLFGVDTVGFNALMAGSYIFYKTGGMYGGFGDYAYFWSGFTKYRTTFGFDSYDKTFGYAARVFVDGGGLDFSQHDKRNGFSIRCVKYNEDNGL